MIQLQELTKRYGQHVAVDQLNLDIQPGELFGFLGPNGAGKTTTIKMLAGLLRPTSGRIVLAGHDLAREPEKAKAALGFIPDRPYLYEKLTAFEFLDFVGGLHRMEWSEIASRGKELLETFGLADWADSLIENFSHGMKQRLVMAASFIHDPKVLVVDEPMVGLDPKGARLIKDIFRTRCQAGATIFMSTHTLEVAQVMCDRIGIIFKGKLIALGSMDELQHQAESEISELEPIFLKLTGGEGFLEAEGAGI